MSEFDSCQGNVRELTKSQGSVGGNLVWKTPGNVRKFATNQGNVGKPCLRKQFVVNIMFGAMRVFISIVLA